MNGTQDRHRHLGHADSSVQCVQAHVKQFDDQLLPSEDDGKSDCSDDTSDSSRLGDNADTLYFVDTIRGLGALTTEASVEITDVSQLINAALLDSDGMLNFIDDDELSTTAALDGIARALNVIRYLEVSISNYSEESFRANMDATQANMLRFVKAAFPGEPPHMWLPSLERLRRFLWHPGCSSSTLDPHRATSFMGADVDPAVYEAVRRTSAEGVDIGTPLGSDTVFLEPTPVAAQHEAVINDHLYGYVQLQFSYVFPACCKNMLIHMCTRGARMHYVKDQDRPVVDPKSANEASPDMQYGDVAAEYPR